MWNLISSLIAIKHDFDIKLGFINWVVYNLIILYNIILYNIILLIIFCIQKFRKSSMFSRNCEICLENWKLWQALTAVELNTFG